MTEKKYVHQMTRLLKCSKKRKKEVEQEFMSEIQGDLQSGETLQNIIKRIGRPQDVADEFNQNFSEKEKKTYHKQKIMKILLTIVIVIVVLSGVIYFEMPHVSDIAKSKYFQEEELTQQSEEVAKLMADKQFDEILEDYCGTAIQNALTADELDQNYKLMKDDWGSYVSLGNIYMNEVRQAGKTYAVVQANVSYENIAITYTLSYDKNLKLIGFYMK